MPIYNGEQYLAETLGSLLNQTFADFELIIADNASTDRTHDICRAYAAKDARIRYVRNENNIGVYRNCNKTFRLCSGEYFKLACADDLCHPQLLERCVGVLDADPTIVTAYARTQFIDQDRNPLAITDPGWHLMSDVPVDRMRYVIASGHWVNVFFGLTRSKDLAQTRLFPLYLGGDCRLIGELSLRGKLFEIPEHLFFRRLHPKAASQNSGPDWESEFFRGRPGHIDLPFWHICLDHTRVVLCSELNARDKISCIRLIAHRMVDGKRGLLKELYTACKYQVRLCLTAIRSRRVGEKT